MPSVNSSAEGKVYPGYPFEVSADRVAAFRGVFGESRDIVPPTFLTAAEFTSLPHIVADPELGLDFARVLHTEQEYEWSRPLAPGETLSARARIAEARIRAGMGLMRIETVLRDDVGTVALCRATLLERRAQ